MAPNVFDKAGIITRRYLSKEEISKLVVVGSDPGNLARSLFHLDNPQASSKAIPAGAGYDLAKLPAGREWALVIGDHSLAEDAAFQLRMSGFTLARATGTFSVDFTRSEWPGLISRARGLSDAEGWGGHGPPVMS